MEELRTLARELLSSEKVQVVIGYEDAPRGGGVRAVFITDPDDADRLVFDERCKNNLAVYLQKKRKQIRSAGRPAVVVKGCDARAVAGLIRDSQIERDDVELIGVQCAGVKDDQGSLAARCHGCDCVTPELYDHLLGTETDVQGEGDPLGEQVATMEAMSADDRWEFWLEELSRCTRCNACREVCPICYCERCVQDKTVPQWIDSSAHKQGNLSWHITRAMHLAGRFVGCGECERACHAGLPLAALMKKVRNIVEESFGEKPHGDPERVAPLGTFSQEDDDSLFK